MATRRYKPEQIVNLLRQIEVEMRTEKRPRKPTPQAYKEAKITVQTYYRSRDGPSG